MEVTRFINLFASDFVRKTCLSIISRHMDRVSRTPGFCALPQHLMLEIVQEAAAKLSIKWLNHSYICCRRQSCTLVFLNLFWCCWRKCPWPYLSNGWMLKQDIYALLHLWIFLQYSDVKWLYNLCVYFVKTHAVQIYSGITSGRVLKGELYMHKMHRLSLQDSSNSFNVKVMINLVWLSKRRGPYWHIAQNDLSQCASPDSFQPIIKRVSTNLCWMSYLGILE